MQPLRDWLPADGPTHVHNQVAVSENSTGLLCIATPVPGTARPSEWRKLWSPSFPKKGPPKWNVPPLKPLSCSKPLLFPLLIEAEMINRPWVYGSIKDKNHHDTEYPVTLLLFPFYNQAPYDLGMLAHCTATLMWLGDKQLLNTVSDTRWGLQFFRILRRK